MADNQRGNVGSVLLESLGQAAAQFGQSLAQRKQMERQAMLQALQLYGNLQQQQQQMTLDKVRTEYYQYRTAQANAEAKKAYLEWIDWSPWAKRKQQEIDMEQEARRQLLRSSVETATELMPPPPAGGFQSVTVSPTGGVTLRRPAEPREKELSVRDQKVFDYYKRQLGKEQAEDAFAQYIIGDKGKPDWPEEKKEYFRILRAVTSPTFGTVSDEDFKIGQRQAARATGWLEEYNGHVGDVVTGLQRKKQDGLLSDTQYRAELKHIADIFQTTPEVIEQRYGETRP